MSAPFSAGGHSRTIDIDGPVHYLDMGGTPDGPLVVAVHGLGGSHLNWAALGPRLSRHGRVVALDLVGHGLTPRAARTADLEGHRRLLSGFLASLGGRPAILVGNSMGGLVAALQAAEEPDSVAGLVLIDPALPTARLGLVHPRVIANFLLCAVPGVGQGYLAQRRRRTTAEQSVHRVLDVCCADASLIPSEVVAAHVALTEQSDRAQGDASYLRSARSLARVMADPTATLTALQRIDQPTLLLHGDRDVLVPLASARRMHTAHPDWRFEVAPGVGHLPMLEAPAWTGDTIVDWLAHEGAPAAAVSAGPDLAALS
jgi:pimeloyl-ACP methyl ester carboxylesterase